MSDSVFDFVVIGGGVAGASIAWSLSAHGRVALLGREAHAGYHSTGRSAASYIEGYGDASARALTRASFDFYTNPPEGFAPTPLVSDRGILFIAAPGRAEAVDALAATLSEQGTAYVRDDAETAMARAPVLRPEFASGSLYDPKALEIDVDALLQGYLRGLRRRGGEIYFEAELQAAQRVGSAWRLRAADRTLSCGWLINAAGAWGDLVAARCGARPVGLNPLRRTAIIVDAPEGRDVSRWPIVMDIDESFYFKPEAGRLLCSPADETPVAPHDAYADEYDIAVAADRLQTATTIEVSRVRRSWAGLRTFAPDRTIVAGPDPDVAGLFWSVGQGGYGVQTAPALGRFVAMSILNAGPPSEMDAFGLDPAALSPSRFR